MTAEGFAHTIADTLFGPNTQTGRHLVRTAMRLLAHGKPVTITELAEAAQDWAAVHPDGTVLPVADAYPQLRPISNQLLD